MFRSKLGTVKMVGDIYYDKNYNEVYVPLTLQDALRFVNAVNKEEAELKRQLSRVEVMTIVFSFDSL